MSNHLKSNYEDMIVLDVTPRSANWGYLSFRVIQLRGEQVYLHQTRDTELALVPLSGSGVVQTSAGDFPLKRAGVFQEKPSVLYLPPGQEFGVITDDNVGSFEFAVGSAPAAGKYPLTPTASRVYDRVNDTSAASDRPFAALDGGIPNRTGSVEANSVVIQRGRARCWIAS